MVKVIREVDLIRVGEGIRRYWGGVIKRVGFIREGENDWKNGGF